jgi:DNA-binding Lrp family transcriptional regulator
MAYDDGLRFKILNLLMEDARLSHREIAAKLGVSPTTVGKVLKKLEDDKVVQGYTTMVDWSKLGYDSVMCLQLAASPNAGVEQLGKVLKNNPAVKQVFYTMGDMTFACYAVCKDNQEAAQLMKALGKIDGIEKLVCHTVLRQF